MVPAARITIVDNVFSNLGAAPYYGDGIPLQILGGTYDILVAHNSWSNAGNQAISFDGRRDDPHGHPFEHSSPRRVWREGHGRRASGMSTLNAYIPGGVFSYDAIVGGDCSLYPSTTLCPSSMPSAPGLGYDARTIGADVAKVNAMTSGVIVAP